MSVKVKILLIGGPGDGEIRAVSEQTVNRGILQVPVLMETGQYACQDLSIHFDPISTHPTHTYRIFPLSVPHGTPEIPILFAHESVPDERVFPRLLAAYVKEENTQ